MNTIPERLQSGRTEAPALSRLARMRMERKDPEYFPAMPPLSGGEYLLAHLYDVGPVQHGGMGEAPVSALELEAWARLQGLELQPWEAGFIRRLSREHVMQSQLSEKLDCIAPWSPDEFAPEDLKVVAASLKDSLRGLATL